MPLQKYIFNPGINKEGTDYTAEGGWFDGNLVRFRKGLPEKIGGWVKFVTASFNGTGRKLFGWTSLAGTKLLGLGTRYQTHPCLLYTSPSPRDGLLSRMPSSA